MTRVMRELEEGGPENVGAPVRGVAVLAQDVGGLFQQAEGALAERRQRATAVALARRAGSLAAAGHGGVGDRPGLPRAWARNLAELADTPTPTATEDCVRALARVAALALALPVLPEDQWQAEMIAFADEALLDELRVACLQLASAAMALA